MTRQLCSVDKRQVRQVVMHGPFQEGPSPQEIGAQGTKGSFHESAALS